MLSVGNMSGRVLWGYFSDVFGRKTTFNIFTYGSVPLYFVLPYCISSVVSSPSTVPLGVFIGSTVVIISIMGGIYATLPAYEADIFG